MTNNTITLTIISNSLISSIHLVLKFSHCLKFLLHLDCLNEDPNKVHTLQLADTFLKSLLIYRISHGSFLPTLPILQFT